LKAAFLYGKEDIRVEKIEIPAIGDDEILIKVDMCGICGSDIRTYFMGAKARYKFPLIMGHEIIGKVAKTGKNVQGYTIGERVTPIPIISCGKCWYCTNGRENLCANLQEFGINYDGGFQEYLVIPTDVIKIGGLVKVSDEVTDIQAAMAEPIACCIHGQTNAHVGVGSHVVVVGEGPMGILHTKVAKLMGAAKVIVTGMITERLQKAKEAGADYIIDIREKNAYEEIMRITGGLGADAVIVAAPVAAAAKEALKFVRQKGTLVLFAGNNPGSELCFEINDVHYSEINITGSINCNNHQFLRALELSPKMNIEPLITDIVSLDEIGEALANSRDTGVLKMLVDLNK